MVGKIPDGTVVYAIGDIHGRADLLHALEASIAEDADRRAADTVMVVYIGDYIDRGPHSAEVLASLVEKAEAGPGNVFLRGNHEQALLDFMDGDLEMGAAWMGFGGNATAASYGIDIAGNPEDLEFIETLKDQLSAAIPQEHWTFLRATKFSHHCGTYAFVHAGIRPGTPLAEQDPEDLLWVREPFLRSRRIHDQIIIHGHSVVPEVEFHENRIAIDTAAFATGTLSCLILQGDTREIMAT